LQLRIGRVIAETREVIFLALVVGEEEQLVFGDWAANGEPWEDTLIEGSLPRGIEVEGVARRSMLRAVENLAAAVEFVRAALGHDVDRRAGGETELRGE
jgi:hypothetical protein